MKPIAHPRRLDPDEMRALGQYLRLALKPSPERRQIIDTMRRKRLSDVQADFEAARDEGDWTCMP